VFHQPLLDRRFLRGEPVERSDKVCYISQGAGKRTLLVARWQDHTNRLQIALTNVCSDSSLAARHDLLAYCMCAQRVRGVGGLKTLGA